MNDRFAACGKTVVYCDGEVVFRQGDPAECLYLIQSGAIRIRKEGDLVTTVVAELGEGEMFGESGLLEVRPRAATALAVGDTQLACYDRQTFLDALREDPELALRAMAALMERLRHTTETLQQLATQHVLDRTDLALTQRAILESALA